jgi:type VI secretion system protein ImpC
VIVGNFTFGPGDEDTRLLARLAQITQRSGAPFLAQASPQLLGCTSLADTPSPRDWKRSGELAGWSELRRLPAAEAVGLALPRFLLRLPYGEKTSPLESFDFEEFPDSPTHEDYLWGNPAFALALLLGQSFSQSGWEMRPGESSEVDGLPLHVYRGDGGSDIKPCAEVLLTDEGVERMLAEGLMPLVSFKSSDKVRVANFRSIADPASSLAARWTE